MLGSVGETAFPGVIRESVLSRGTAETLADGSTRMTGGRQADLAKKCGPPSIDSLTRAFFFLASERTPLYCSVMTKATTPD